MTHEKIDLAHNIGSIEVDVYDSSPRGDIFLEVFDTSGHSTRASCVILDSVQARALRLALTRAIRVAER